MRQVGWIWRRVLRELASTAFAFKFRCRCSRMDEGDLWNGTSGDVFDQIDDFFLDLPSDDEQLFGLPHDHNPPAILPDQLLPPIGPLDLDWLHPIDSYEEISSNIENNNKNDGMVSSPFSVLEQNSFGGNSSSTSTGNNNNENDKACSAAATSRRRARTKRSRPSVSSSSRVLAVESFIETPTPSAMAPMVKKHKYKKRKKNVEEEGEDTGGDDEMQQQSAVVSVRKCMHCGIQKTPQWRAGPMGPKTLCNACGVRYKSGRLFPEYRPAASPTFIPSLHSNSHKKVVEMRLKSNNQMAHCDTESPALKNCELIHYIRRKEKRWEEEQDLCGVV
ncbi:hypothetical protein J5N97_028889 [Dioscorea zingiberensis]|uniref:GATA-type domain-containing protein n=1 Tax=Dioscorea zingiberensis TaxID=325984 RepID=A0A9D5H5D9_9LILI|nr:hypothetical protein J5N97_028889 [Dioscorea zingiberensis]